jgi:hypothetical protein
LSGFITIDGNEIIDAAISTVFGTYTMPGPFNPGPYTGTNLILDYSFANAACFPDNLQCYDQALLGLSADPATLLANNGGFFSGSEICVDCTGFATFTNGVIGNPVPLPAALPLFATGLGVLGLLGRRKQPPDQNG